MLNDDSLLLVIDMQEGFRFPESEKIIENIQFVASFFDNVIFTKFVDYQGSLFDKQLHWNTFQDKEKQKIMSEFLTLNFKLFDHNTYNPITEEVRLFIKNNNFNKIFIVGVYTDVSILLSAMLLFDMGIETFVVGDACNSVHKNQINNLHASSLESLSHILGKDHVIETGFFK